ncbi:hypothetical protein GJ689_24715 [Rhodoplanes serenus]|uniref:Large polyvalent protein associated domain-containing protein n=1 Tax=Rhodoplanes serenus TaxID=200615 RepID=A0A9X5AU82_9BRAD|nr:LPD23 domain-containing protein [Rhodoplanes serenus]MTW19397.1 hypothetical protein [Rhodoplanes serenus]
MGLFDARGVSFTDLLSDARGAADRRDPVSLAELGVGLGIAPEPSPAEIAAARLRRSVRPEDGRRESMITRGLDAAGSSLGRTAGGLVDGAVRGVMAPGNAYRSTPDNPATTEQMIAPATDLAGILMGGAPATAVRGAAGVFGGRLAQTADHAALARAEAMTAAGEGRKAIWREAYHRLRHEVEARNAGDWALMSSAERAKSAPWQTADVPVSKQITDYSPPEIERVIADLRAGGERYRQDGPGTQELEALLARASKGSAIPEWARDLRRE